MSRSTGHLSLGRSYVKRALGLSCLLSILGVFLANLADSWGDYSLGVRNCLFYFTTFNYSFGIFSKLTYVFCAIPFAANYVTESNTTLRQYTIFRTTGKKYAWTNLLMTAFSGGFTLALGMVLFIVFMRFQMPFFTEDYLDMIFVPDGYEYFLVHDRAIIYYIIMVVLEFLKGAVWASIGMTISAYIRINYVAIFSPLLVSYTYIEMCKALQIPDLWRIDRIFSIQYSYPSTAISLAIVIGTTLTVFLICGCIFSKKIIRSVENE